MKNTELIGQDYHANMLARSLISTGNNYRMKKAIHKAKQGEDVTLVFLGGSITLLRKEFEDTGFAAISYRYYKEKFGRNGKVNYINSGMNGTSSMIGLIRVERDVVKYRPDIVFIEFSVNDSKDSLHREIFESLVLRILSSDSKPAVVLLFMQSEAGYSCQGHMQAIGEYYRLPMISVCDAIRPEIEAKRMLWSEYAADNIHPHSGGNALTAELIRYYLDTVEAMPPDRDLQVPAVPFYGNSFLSMKMLDSENIQTVFEGGFRKVKTIDAFPNGWVHLAEAGRESFHFKLKFRSLFVVYKENRALTEGSIIIDIDGKDAGSLCGYRTFGWNNPVTGLVFREEGEKVHTVEIRMAPGDEKKEFCLLAFGYCGS